MEFEFSKLGKILHTEFQDSQNDTENPHPPQTNKQTKKNKQNQKNLTRPYVSGRKIPYNNSLQTLLPG